MTITSHHAPAELFRTMLEEEFAVDTIRLAQLTQYQRLPEEAGFDPEVLDGLITSVRQRIAATAHALKRMSEGTYGLCEHCGKPIPLGRLRIAPAAVTCVHCEQIMQDA